MGKNRTCIICGTKYEYCGHCDNNLNINETWRNIYCSEKCRETFKVFEQFKAKKITADEAAAKLEKLGVDKAKVGDRFKKNIQLIEAHRTKPQVAIKVEAVTEPIQQEVIPVKKRKRKRKTNIVNEIDK